MSIPGETPNPYGQPQPPQQPQHSAYGVPQQPQPQAANPYAQPTMAAMPAAGYGQTGAPMGMSPAMPPGIPAGGGGKGGKGWLWGLGGAVVASAVWAGVVLATGGFGGGEKKEKPDLAGYVYTDNLCDSTDTETFETEGYDKKDDSSSSTSNPTHSSSQDPALDSMTCNIDFKPDTASSSDYSSVWLYTTASRHKKTNPAPEFEATYRAYEDQKSSSYSYEVKAVGGLGDEAYVVTQTNRSSSSTSGAYVILAVRDGWVTYQSTWSEYISSSSDTRAKTSDEATDMLKKSAKATLEKMRD
ncbi:hypothetical protein [Streptomyces cucumeris]|uniref:hypothetical protein n=1 Tax=Streptomyces cucumeris TaxID=2962890 RepID=UPI003D760E1E